MHRKHNSRRRSPTFPKRSVASQRPPWKSHHWQRTTVCGPIHQRVIPTSLNSWSAFHHLPSLNRWTNWMAQPRDWGIFTSLHKPLTKQLEGVTASCSLLLELQTKFCHQDVPFPSTNLFWPTLASIPQSMHPTCGHPNLHTPLHAQSLDPTPLFLT